MHELVDEAELERLFGAHVLAGENEIQRVGKTNSTRQALRTARTRNQSELDFGESEDGFRMIRRNAVSAGERRFEPAAEARAVNRRHDRNAQVLDGVEEHLTVATQPLGVARGLQLQKLLDVGAGDPDIGLAADEYRAVDGGVALESGNEGDEFILHGATQ